MSKILVKNKIKQKSSLGQPSVHIFLYFYKRKHLEEYLVQEQQTNDKNFLFFP